MKSSSARTTMPEKRASPRVTSGDAEVTQLDLFQLPADEADQWELFKKLLASDVEEIGQKDFCFDAGVTKHDLAHALADRNRHHIHARWVLLAIKRAKTDDLLRFIAALRRMDVTTPRTLAPEVENERRKEAAVRLFGAAGAALIEREVFKR